MQHSRRPSIREPWQRRSSPGALPAFPGRPQRLESLIGEFVLEFVIERVGDAFQIETGRVDVAQARLGLDPADREALPIIVVRAEPLDDYARQAARRLQMDQVWKKRCLQGHMLGGLAGKPPDDIPGSLYPVVARPAQEVDILNGFDAFFHQAEDVRAERFYAGLHRQDAAIAQRLDLLAREIGLDLEEDLVVPRLARQGRRQLPNEVHRYDVVCGKEPIDAVTSRELGELL